MSRQLLLFFDRVPRFLSLTGVLGLAGFAGLFEPAFYRLSALSFLSYSCFLRFFRRFVDPGYGPGAASVPALLLALVVAAAFPWLFSISPAFGFIGFAGFLGLHDAANRHRGGVMADSD
jgi:hypothetical protein